ncbi:hypothetical protein [Kitasatospora sp. GP82]|uniref:WXG100-like domain-containing protein n=1 Tax=Kitasatospora sp. GP82 TaxID=3035089 RepID=UPI00247378AE|nr:hypothetical protein [Kitasatospora sp. GP82]MDH6127406.1 hypothetical protein [Kitasatospora sp. GP82]
MALELPPELGTVLGLLGVDWPQANEDEVVRLADELRKLASAVDSVQMAADKALGMLGEVYHGASADRLAELWGSVSAYSRLVVEGCGATATALNAAALVIEGCKGATLTQLVATQGELAAASATGPWSSAAIVAAGKQIVSGILEEAVSALGHALAQPVGDLVETVVKDVTGGGSGSSNSPGFGVDLGQLASCALELRRHGDDIDSNGNSFRRVVEGLDVGRPGDMFGRLVIAAAEQIATSVGVEVLKRLLGSFRGTADRMDQVARNLTENEDSHTQRMQGILAGQSSPSAPGPLRLAGGAGDAAAGGPRPAGLAVDGAARSGLDHVGTGAVGGGEGFAGAAGLLVGGGAGTGRASGPLVPDRPAAQVGHADTLPRQPQAPAAGPRPVFAPQGAEPGGLGRQSLAQTPGAPGPVAYGRAGGGRHQGQGVAGQVRAAAAEQQRSTLRTRQDAPSEDPVELLAVPSRDDATPDS